MRLLRLNVARTWFVKHEAEHIRARVDGGSRVFMGAQSAYFHLYVLVGSAQERAHLGRDIPRNDQRLTYEHGLYIIACQATRIRGMVNATLGDHHAVSRNEWT